MATPSAFVPWMIPHEASLFDTGASHAHGSDARFTNCRLSKETDDDAIILLRPIVQEKQPMSALPSLQDVMFLPEEYDDPSASPPGSRSQSLSSWSPIDDSSSDTSRKNSIASLLNSPVALSPSTPPVQLQQLQQQHQHQHQQQQQQSLKRGRPRQNPTTMQQVIKRLKRPSQVAATEEKKRGGDGSNNSAGGNAVTKGLRHFSKLVSDKVAERGVTTYNQVADELAAEIRDGRKQGYDQKNIRRRVYDALNVLMAMDIIAKDKKEIRWLGIPASLQQPVDHQQHQQSSSNTSSSSSTKEREQLMQQIQQEEQRQHELMQATQQMRSVVSDKMEQYLQIRQLIHRNQLNGPTNSSIDGEDNNISLPFFVVGCSDPHHVDVAQDGREAVISSNSSSSNDDDDDQGKTSMPIYEDARVLQVLGFHHMSRQDKLAFLPDPNWAPYLQDTVAAAS